jgi:hypothetical protein
MLRSRQAVGAAAAGGGAAAGAAEYEQLSVEVDDITRGAEQLLDQSTEQQSPRAVLVRAGSAGSPVDGSDASKPRVHTSRQTQDGRRIIPRKRDTFLSLDAYLTEVDTMNQKFSLQGNMTMMMDLSPEDVADLKHHGGIHPFPEVEDNGASSRRPASALSDLSLSTTPKVLKELGEKIKRDGIDLDEDTWWTPSPHTTCRRRTAIQSFSCAELDDPETLTDLNEWLPVSPHRLFHRHDTEHIATWPALAMVYHNHPQCFSEDEWNQEWEGGNCLAKGGLMLCIQVRFEVSRRSHEL